MDRKVGVLILGMAIVTYLPRYLPFAMMRKFNIPKGMNAWFKYLPVSILTILAINLVLAPEGRVDISLRNPYLLASVPTIIIAKLSSNLILSIVAGMIAYWLINRMMNPIL